MHLRAIILDGFKTFARRTEIRFDGGMVAIVGPNGSGKSNIVDAFKWVLGETQAKDLRGARMEEVIHAGGERGGRASAAEVSLLLDNADGRLPLDYEEVAIRRRVERGGASDYYLNGSRVRRRDIQQLLSSTGLTVDGYSIVNQGDIEAIVTASASERRRLLEEAAQVGGVKRQRVEAAAKLQDLAQNLLRLEDLRGELEPRRAALREQAEAAREASEAHQRLEVLRGSIVFEEWRESRDQHRRLSSQKGGLERRLEEARGMAESAERDFQEARAAMEAAQNRRLAQQQALGALRLDLSQAEHAEALAKERLSALDAAAQGLREELGDLERRGNTAAALQVQLEKDRSAAEAELAASQGAQVPRPETPDPAIARAARQEAARARREAADAASALGTLRARRQFLEETAARLEAQVVPAEERLPELEAKLAEATRAHEASVAAAEEVVRLRAELGGLEELWPEPAPGRRRVADVLTAAPGWEAALSAVLGELVEAWVATDEPDPAGFERQTTVLLAGEGQGPVAAGSLLEHVNVEPGFEWLALRLLAGVRVGDGPLPAVSQAGIYRERGLLRAGADPRVALAARRRRLTLRLQELSPLAGRLPALAGERKRAETGLAELRVQAGNRARLDETRAQLEAARAAETEAARRVPELEQAAEAGSGRAEELERRLADGARILAEWEAERRRHELQRDRWRERLQDIDRQLQAVERDGQAIAAAQQGRSERLASTETAKAETAASLPRLQVALAESRQKLADAEQQSPVGEAELAETARRLVAMEEARVDARLRSRTLEGNLELISREVELLEARLEEIRGRMPLGQAPEEIPGGKAREREMRQLERRLEEIGPVNPLAEREHAELEERCRTLDEQTADVVAAREDLGQLIGRLRQEEDARYEAVFGSVAAGFQEYFAELTAGGKATLKHVPGDDGPTSGVEILVQPPKKRLQNITLLSSGERSLTALALVLALAEVNPAPFMILDEVDAALDDANVGRYGTILRRIGEGRQLLVITHNHLTMASAGALYGIHLDEAGRSHIVSVRLEDIKAVPAARTA